MFLFLLYEVIGNLQPVVCSGYSRIMLIVLYIVHPNMMN